MNGKASVERTPPARLVPLTPELLAFAVALERDPLAAEMAEGESFARRALLPTLSFAMIRGGYVLGAGGLVPQWPGRAEAWLLVSRHARPRDIAHGTRQARVFFDKRQRQPAFRRIEAFIRADRVWNRSFADALGFVHEGRLIAWAPDGADYDLYARVAKERP